MLTCHNTRVRREKDATLCSHVSPTDSRSPVPLELDQALYPSADDIVTAAVADLRPPEVLAGLQGLLDVALPVARTGGLGGCLVGGGLGGGLLLLAQTPGHDHLGILEPREILAHEGIRRRRHRCRGLDLRHVPRETTVVEAAVLDETTDVNAEDCA
jgi:hypothetical protein